jgi:hypothetical protein
MPETVTAETSVAHKSALHANAAGVGATWHYVHFADAAAAVSYANIAPAQTGGEFVFSDSDAGGVDGGYFF